MNIHFRKATKVDVPKIVEMLANDKLGKLREDFRDPLPDIYYKAFQDIEADKNQELIVVETEKKGIIGTLQISFIPYLNRMGGMRAQVEAVRIREDQRGKGLGKTVFEWAINRAKERGAFMIQLTTDKQRPEAIRFYEGLGFTASHEGMKMKIE